MSYIFLTGGARSGKSDAAQRLAMASSRRVTVIATAQALDDEMSRRIERHRALRPSEWVTVEEPLRVGDAVRAAAPDHFVVVDCITHWVSNLMVAADDEILVQTDDLVQALSGRRPGAAVVSNEVGDGIVPTDSTARRYRDLMGRVNSRVADGAVEAYLIVAGQALRLSELRW
jgi:adenosylcobinamide kinase / adenosylcobinamide-phosphate guanylyltransferase